MNSILYEKNWLDIHYEDIKNLSSARLLWIIHHDLINASNNLNIDYLNNILSYIDSKIVNEIKNKQTNIKNSVLLFSSQYTQYNVSEKAHKEYNIKYKDDILKNIIIDLNISLKNNKYDINEIFSSIKMNKIEELVFQLILSSTNILNCIEYSLSIWIKENSIRI